jgi:hypothetical protein
MRSRDDLRRQAGGLFPMANDADRGEPQPNSLTMKPLSGEVLAAKGLAATDRARTWS